ncbi:MAG: hypothetical protein IAE94_06900 [Chthoniobacterales bacterium]|nr:hypothetical protein [Chthoniobacterales bacterium]
MAMTARTAAREAHSAMRFFRRFGKALLSASEKGDMIGFSEDSVGWFADIEGDREGISEEFQEGSATKIGQEFPEERFTYSISAGCKPSSISGTEEW